MTNKPRDLVYGVNDTPPLGVTILSGLQHVGIIGIILVYPLLIAREAGLAREHVFDFLGVAMPVLGAAAVLQALPRGPVGARYLCPAVLTAAYLTPSLTAVSVGGLALVFGMTAFGGAIELSLSRFLRSLRPYFPSELSGFVVAMIGVSVGSLGLRHLLGLAGKTAPGVGVADLGLAAITLATMIALNVWTQGPPRIFCAFIGMVLGYLVAAATGLITGADVAVIGEAPLVKMPGLHHHPGWAFDASLIVPFGVAALATAIRTIRPLTDGPTPVHAGRGAGGVSPRGGWRSSAPRCR